jgi:hypothetical protein
MHRLSLVLALLAASTAHAASISLQFNDNNYSPGETGTLSVIATANAGEVAFAVEGQLRFTSGSALLFPSVIQVPLESFGGALQWTTGPLQCNTSTCDVFNQISATTTPLSVTNTPLVIATLTFFVTSFSHYIDVTWESADFFGATPSGACALVGIPENGEPTCGSIPEPATGALLALGLLTLATAARRRTR